jgi:hypothetical protein
MDAWGAGAEEGEMPQKGVCISQLATRPIMYTDTINGGQQAMRDDLWAVTTAELNALHLAQPTTAAGQPAEAAAQSEQDARDADDFEVTDEMIDAACTAVPDLYRVDAARAIEAALAQRKEAGNG